MAAEKLTTEEHDALVARLEATPGTTYDSDDAEVIAAAILRAAAMICRELDYLTKAVLGGG